MNKDITNDITNDPDTTLSAALSKGDLAASVTKLSAKDDATETY